MKTSLKPTDINIHQQSKKMEITFANNETYSLPFELLRVYSPSAEVRGHFGQGAKLVLNKQDVIIKDVKLVGHYALKIFYDDGHDSGLYDWNYLYELGKKQAIYWTDYLDRVRQHKETSGTQK